MHILNQEVRTEPLDAVRPHPRNPRQRDVGAIAESIDENGFYGVVVAQRSTGYILAGNHRWLAARAAGAMVIPVAWLDVDDETALRILLVDNRTNDFASYDSAELAGLLQELLTDTGSLSGTGYDHAALDSLLADLTSEPDPDDEPDPEAVDDEDAAEGGTDALDEVPEFAEARCTTGDLWALGPHRLLVGDCRDEAGRDRLFAGAEPDCIVFDPPFQWDRVYDWIPESGGASGPAALIVFTDAFRLAEAIVAATERGWRFRFELVWDGLSSWYTAGRPLARHKVALLFGRFEWDFEAAVFINAEGERKHLTTVYPQGNSSVAGEHAHAKPLYWITAMLAGVGAQRIWDLCAGSGTALLAADRIGASVFASEIAPETADILLARWEAAGDGRGASRLTAGDGPPPVLPTTPDQRRYERSKFYRSAAWRKLRKEVLERDGYRCVKCGVAESVDRLHVDHIETRNDGGSDDPSNLQTLCHACHSAKTRATT